MKLLCSATAMIICFFLVSCGGNDSTSGPSTASTSEPAKPAASDTANKAPATSAMSGEAIYKRTCIACHQPNGLGIAATFPPLAHSDFITDREKTISQVLKGKSGELVVNGTKYNNVMPPQPLSDDEIAAVLTYVYSNFGNSGPNVTAEQVKAIRAKN